VAACLACCLLPVAAAGGLLAGLVSAVAGAPARSPAGNGRRRRGRDVVVATSHPIRSRDLTVLRIAPFQASFPDVHMEIVELVAEGDRVVGRFTCSATHQGKWLGQAPTGRRFDRITRSGFSGSGTARSSTCGRWRTPSGDCGSSGSRHRMTDTSASMRSPATQRLIRFEVIGGMLRR
jgi:hypothetical protein